jgi:hypothetical protein
MDDLFRSIKFGMEVDYKHICKFYTAWSIICRSKIINMSSMRMFKILENKFKGCKICT